VLIDEPGSDAAAQIYDSGGELVSVALLEVEARAALAAAERARRITTAQHRRAKRSSALLDGIDPSSSL
jgi:hypothetical protein